MRHPKRIPIFLVVLKEFSCGPDFKHLKHGFHLNDYTHPFDLSDEPCKDLSERIFTQSVKGLGNVFQSCFNFRSLFFLFCETIFGVDELGDNCRDCQFFVNDECGIKRSVSQFANGS